MENKMIHKFTVFLVLLLIWTVTMVNTLAANEEDVFSLAGAVTDYRRLCWFERRVVLALCLQAGQQGLGGYARGRTSYRQRA